ncbi:MAG: hypothetical protein ACLFOZ_09795 [Cyclobacteriaceae bacterium]
MMFRQLEIRWIDLDPTRGAESQTALFGLSGCDCHKQLNGTPKKRKGKKADQPLSGFKVDQYYFDFIPKADKKVYGEAKSIKEMLTVVKQHLESNFVGKSFYNRHTKKYVKINQDTVGKWYSKNVGELKVKSFTAIKDIIKVAVHIAEKPHKRNNLGIVAMHEFWSIVEVEGKIYPFGFLAKETKEGRFVYHATLIPTPKNVEKLDGIEKKKENDSAASFGLSYTDFARHFPSNLKGLSGDTSPSLQSYGRYVDHLLKPVDGTSFGLLDQKQYADHPKANIRKSAQKDRLNGLEVSTLEQVQPWPAPPEIAPQAEKI